LKVCLPASAEESANESADNSCTKRHPPSIVTAMMVDLMVFVMMFGCWAMMCLPLRRMMLWSRRALRGLVFGGGLRGAVLAATGSCHGSSAESYAGKGENHQLFESFVHSAPSLSSFVLTRTFLAAYIKIGDVSVIF
jgi:hypothetical protein